MVPGKGGRHEVDIDILGAYPKPITREIEEASDVIVTLDVHDDVPVVDGKRYIAWSLPDLHEEGLDGYRQLRDELSSRIDDLLGELA